MTAKVRGRNLIPLRAFVKERYGDEGWKRFLAAVTPRYRPIWDGLIAEWTWYDRTIDTDGLAALKKVFGEEDGDVVRRLAMRVARHHDRLYMRPILILGGPHLLFRRAGALYQEYYQGPGTLTLVEEGDRWARVVLDDPAAPPAFCEESLPGFMEEIIRLAGRWPVVTRQETCTHRGGARCALYAAWL